MSKIEISGVSWPYDLIEATQDQRLSRVGLTAGRSAELTGVDGTMQGGLRPLSGFKLVRELDFYNDNHDTQSIVIDFRAVNFRIGDTDYGYGFVYLVQRSTAQTSDSSGGTNYGDVFLDYYNSRTGAWSTGNKVMDQVDTSRQFDVAIVGKLGYVFLRGRSPSRFRIADDNTVEVLGLTGVDSVPGPGLRPDLISPEDVTAALGTLAPPTDSDQPARGQVVLTEDLPSATGLFSFAGNSSSSSGQDTSSVDQDPTAFKLEFGDYAFSYILHNSQTGAWSAWSAVAFARGRNFNLLPGVSTSDGGEEDDFRDHYVAMEIVYDTTEFDEAYIYRTVRTQEAGGTFSSVYHWLDNIITLADYHTVLQPEADYGRAVYYYQLEDKQLPSQKLYTDMGTFDAQMPHGGAALFYEGSLLVAAIDVEGNSHPEVNRIHDEERGLGETRWSSLKIRAPELFPPEHRLTPEIPSNEVLRLIQVGGNVIGFSIDRQYHFRKESVYLRPSDMHEGYGIVAPRAADTTGSFIYFVSPKGLKAVDSVGQLDDVGGLNKTIIEDWADTLESVSAAYDPAVGAFFILNSDLAETHVLWFNSSRVTKIEDTPFVRTTRGVWPSVLDDATSTLSERAFFLQNSPDSSAALTGWKPRIYVLDHKREKVISGDPTHNGLARLTTLDITGSSRFEVSSYDSGTGLLTVVGSGPVFGTQLEGAEVYVIEQADGGTSRIGVKGTVFSKGSSTTVTIVTGDRAGLAGLVAGDRIALSPMYWRWVGWPLSTQSESGFAFGGGFTQLKMATRLGGAFASVEGAPADEDDIVDDKYRGLMFQGIDEDPLTSAYPLSNDGELIDSILDDEPVEFAHFGYPNPDNLDGAYGVQAYSLTPGMEIICPDLDFVLLGVVVDGKIVGSATSRRSA